MKPRKIGLREALAMVSPLTMAAILAASAAMVILAFAIPLTVLQVYDRILAYGSRSTLLWLASGCLAAITLNALLEFGRSALGAWTAAKFVRSADDALVERLLSAAPETVRLEGSARHLERFRSLSGIAASILGRSLPALAEAPFAVVYLILLLVIGREAAFAPIGAVLAEFAIALAARMRSIALAEEGREKERALSDYIVYALDRIHFIKAQALEHTALKGFERMQADELETRSRKMSMDRRLDEASRMISAAATFGTILWGGVLIARGELTIGAVSACLFFASRLVGVAREIRRAVFSLSDAKADLLEFSLGLGIEPRAGAGEPGLPRGIDGRLEFAAVSFRRQAKNPEAGGTEEACLGPVSFIARPGEALLVEGPDGAWRSIVCRLAAGMLAPSSGQVLLDAYPSSAWDFRGEGGLVGYISSRSGVLSGSILDNIASFDPQRREGALDIAQLLGLDKVVSRLSKGFETAIGPADPGGLSESSIRLVTVARALALRPRLLVWDDADANLDAEARAMVLDLLVSMKGATTIVLNTDDAAFRGLADSSVTAAAAGGAR